jgi:hypothetical protein
MPHATLPSKARVWLYNALGLRMVPTRFSVSSRRVSRRSPDSLARGSPGAIAQELVLTPGTVANHVAHILAKTGARSRVHLAVNLVRTDPAAGPATCSAC